MREMFYTYHDAIFVYKFYRGSRLNHVFNVAEEKVVILTQIYNATPRREMAFSQQFTMYPTRVIWIIFQKLEDGFQ